MSNKQSNDVVRRRVVRRVSEEEAAMRRGEVAAIDERGGDDPGQPLEVGVPKVSINGMSLKTHTPPVLENCPACGARVGSLERHIVASCPKGGSKPADDDGDEMKKSFPDSIDSGEFIKVWRHPGQMAKHALEDAAAVIQEEEEREKRPIQPTPIHMEFDSYVSSWSRLLLLRVDGYKCAEVSLEFLTNVLTQDRLMSEIEIQGAIFDLAKVGVPGLSIDSGFTCCGIRLWVSFPALVMTKERVKEALTQRMKYAKERFMEPDWGPRLSRRAFFPCWNS